MTDILTDFSPAALIRANEENMYATTPFSHGWEGAEIQHRPGVNWCVTDVAFPVCNSAFNTSLQPEDADSAIADFTAAGRRNNVPIQWFIGHDTRPEDMSQRLLAHGFTFRGSSTGMAVDMDEIDDDIPLPEGLEIIEVTTDRALRDWSRVMCAAFNAAKAETAMYEWFRRDIAAGMPLKAYLGLLDGKPVATSSYYLAAGVAGIYCIGTREEGRNRGIGYSMTHQTLLKGKKLGYRIGILQASKMGEPIYRRLGFRDYGRISEYAWTPDNKPE